MTDELDKRAWPWTEADGELHAAPQRIEELIARVSIFSVDGANVTRLWDPEYEALDITSVLRSIGCDVMSWSLSLSPVCATPVETGYLECMRLTPAENREPATAAIAAFADRQRKRYANMEKHLAQCYGELTPQQRADHRFTGIDYPVFDLGPVRLGLGIYAEHVRYRHSAIWVWSRAVNWHK